MVKAIIGAMTGAAHRVSTGQFMYAAVAFCQGQEQLEKVSESTVKAVLSLPRINEEVTAACRWYGSERLLVAITSRIVPKLSETEGASEFVENLIATASMPDVVLTHLTRLLVKAILSTETALKERQLLSMVQQRHPQTVQKVTQETIDEDEEQKDVVEELIMSLSTVC